MNMLALGRIAGLGGIAIGAVVLLLRTIIDKAGKAKPEQLALYRVIALGALAIGALGIIASSIVPSGAHVEAGSCGVAAGGNASDNAINCGTVPGAPGKP